MQRPPAASSSLQQQVGHEQASAAVQQPALLSPAQPLRQNACPNLPFLQKLWEHARPQQRKSDYQKPT